ncbi:MAG: acyl-CoA dehydrogenase family protein [Myxococcota bacterium]
MNFGFTEEQDLLRSEARKLLDEESPLERVREVIETPDGFSRELFGRIAELGWTGLTIPEAHGGAGLGWVDAVVLFEETGRSLFPAPLVSTTLATAALLEAGDASQRERWLPGLADGSRIGTLALLEETDLCSPNGVQLAAAREDGALRVSGVKRFVHDVGAADLFVVALRLEGESVLAVLEASDTGVSSVDHPGIDRTRRMGDLQLDGVEIEADRLLRSSDPQATLRGLFDRGAIATTAEMIGAGEAALALTVQYAKDRIQFGEPIGRFQGVKHPLAEMYVDVESYKSLLYYAAWALEGSPDEVPRAASMAKAYASDALARIGVDGVGLHGAVGYTAEYDIQLYLKRSKWARQAFGDADWHYDRIAQLVSGEAA